MNYVFTACRYDWNNLTSLSPFCPRQRNALRRSEKIIGDLKAGHGVAFTHGRGAYTIPLDNLNVGIARQLSENKTAIYPTVFDDFIIIENTDDGKAGDFLLFDMKGSLVFSARITGDRMQKISLPAGLHSGVYIAKAGGQATRLCKK
jgi:hypothetical protein